MGIIVPETSFHYMEKSMNKRDYKPRLIDRKLEEYLNTFGAVCVEGPKWCGKTWSSSYHSNSEIMIGNPDGNFQNRQLAEMSPALVLEGESPRLIDEWQEVPPLWDAVRYKVDQSGKKDNSFSQDQQHRTTKAYCIVEREGLQGLECVQCHCTRVAAQAGTFL